MSHQSGTKAFLIFVAAGVGIVAVSSLIHEDGPTMLSIDASGVPIATLAKDSWDKVCFYPQFSYPEVLNGKQSYSMCKIWTDVAERNILIVFSSDETCESFGVVGDFIGPYYEESLCFSASEVKETRLVDRTGSIRLEN